jgi:hypothetical protein
MGLGSLVLAYDLTRYALPLPVMRYYEQRYPEVDELVMVQVRQIAEMGAYVKLVCAKGNTDVSC